ncbi:hypothetical protein M5K25_002753 [Dendrobium thyrsiflorum]|uniref:Uncharacterized protein n=1 Tax=Dendrobium thyrsiflorum TaxID=117978 RepID=A0ABD0VN38_DENTH
MMGYGFCSGSISEMKIEFKGSLNFLSSAYYHVNGDEWEEFINLGRFIKAMLNLHNSTMMTTLMLY